MSDVHWIKLKTEMFSDDKIRLIESMPEADTILIIWIKLLIQAGKTNENGDIFLNENVPFSAEMLATLFNRPLTIVRLALKTLHDFNMISIDGKGKILIENWSKHQNVNGLDKIREQTRLRVAKHRENQKLLSINKETDIDTDTEECITETLQVTLPESNNINVEFERFWNLYDKKVGKQKSVKSWIKLTSDEKKKIFETISRYVSSTPDKKYRKDPNTYLYNKSWEDEIINIDSKKMKKEFIPLSERMD
ncbi:MAG: phage replisome organizer N-terminal domain-containing protein [Ignavibacteriales bacterium]|nr:phage replisome organizer N-terminal domain-containing protein [Ignavibacteriales bacterium]